MRIFKSAYFYGISSFLMIYPMYEKAKNAVTYMKLEDKSIHAGHNEKEVKQVTETVAHFYDSHDKAIAQKTSASILNNKKLTDTTYVQTFSVAPFAEDEDAERIDLRKIINDAKETNKKSILFSYLQQPNLNFQMSLASAEHIQQKYNEIKTELNLYQDIPLYISSSQEREAYAKHKASSFDYDRWTVISVANLGHKSIEEMDFTLGHELGHQKQSSRKGLFHALFDNLKDFTLKKFKLEDKSKPKPYVFTASKLDELEADSIGAKYSSFRSAVKAMTGFNFNKHKKNLSADEVVRTLREEENDVAEDDTHPPTYLRLREIHRIHKKL